MFPVPVSTWWYIRLVNAIDGTAVANIQVGTPGATGTTTGVVIATEDGDDTMNGDAGDDTMAGGSGNDVMDGGAGDDEAGSSYQVWM